MKSIETEFTRYTIDADGIATGTPLQTDLPRTVDLMQQTLDDLEEFLDAPRPFLWDPRSVVPLRPGAWQAIIDRLERIVLALAIIVDDEEDHQMGAFPFVIDSLMLPVRLFVSEQEARRWLLQHVDPTAT